MKNREIKFRIGFTNHAPIIINWNELLCGEWLANILAFGEGGSIKYKDQFIGLKDNSEPKKEIYEDDLFEITSKDCIDGFRYLGRKTVVTVVTGRVCFNCGGYKIEFMHPELKKLVYMDLHNLLKNPEKIIIGNIHENPELLTNI